MIVGPNLTLPGHSEIFVIGDAAVMKWHDDQQVPGVAQGAIQSGKYVAKVIRSRLSGYPKTEFKYSNRGDVAIIDDGDFADLALTIL